MKCGLIIPSGVDPSGSCLFFAMVESADGLTANPTEDLISELLPIVKEILSSTIIWIGIM